MTGKIRRFFFDRYLCSYEIEKTEGDASFNVPEKVAVRISTGRNWLALSFGKKDRDTLVQFANDLLEMAGKL